MKAIYAGSFDPFTNGHLDIVQDAAGIFEELIVVIAKNSKKSTHYNPDKMQAAMECCFKRLGLDNVVVKQWDGLIADLSVLTGAKYLVRGIRNTTDFLYEEEIANFNARVDPDLKTIYIRAKDTVISSSMVRELIANNKGVSMYVPYEVLSSMA